MVRDSLLNAKLPPELANSFLMLATVLFPAWHCATIKKKIAKIFLSLTKDPACLSFDMAFHSKMASDTGESVSVKSVAERRSW